ncbi:MAG TPA: hypothetical protein VKM72_09940 [Thermoanaerobaculia bacterium]|nr:hypothetical protein [Thermoanaerobaculia bacterium]
MRDHLFFNGVDATTGEYLVAPRPAAEVLDLLRARPIEPARAATRAMVPGFEPRDLAESGWGVVFPRGCDPAIPEALRPLLEHRRMQAAAVREHRYRELELRPGEDLESFLVRHGRGPGPVHPDRLPYYLLLIGDPAEIPFGLQTGLDVQHAVGRLCFDAPEEYERYARRVVEAERGAQGRDRLVDLFAPRNADDPATELSSDHLIAPLAGRLDGALPGWRLRVTAGPRATKQALADLFAGRHGRPALLFTASHGLGFPCGHPDQRERQGALLCQDWPGPQAWKGRPIPPEHSFAAADLEREDVAGLVAFCFACHGAGTPALDEFSHRNGWEPRRIAPRDFLARLPQRLLERGALAVIGHLERAWAYSFLWRDESQVDVFESTLKLLLDGWPVGAAMEYFNQRYAELATLLTAALRRAFAGEPVDAREVTRLWTAHNDARGYVVVGDPAVRVDRMISPPPAAPSPASGPA